MTCKHSEFRCQVLVVGGGSGGCAVAAKLSNKLGEGRVIILDPADVSINELAFQLTYAIRWPL